MNETSWSNSGGISSSVSSPSSYDSLNAGDSAASSTSISSAHLTSFFACTVCFDCILPPILQCSNGHLVCGTCRLKLSRCMTCCGLLGNIRNLALEKLASTLMFPCKYSSFGCPLLLSHSDKAKHEASCEHCPYTCPCPSISCKWQGKMEQILEHLLSVHESITTLEGDDIIFLATDIHHSATTVNWVMLQSCLGHHFLLVLEKKEKYPGYPQFFAFVQMIGSRKQCEGFGYRLELNGDKRRLTWEATPRSIREKISTTILNAGCLVMDTRTARLFIDGNNLAINVTISPLV